MTQTYRTDDLARWGTGQGFNLSPAQVDNNFWDLVQRMLVQEDRVIPAGIDHFSISGNMMYVHMTDDVVLGPYELPIAIFRSRGEWAPDTVYEVLDTFSINGGLYVVIFQHTSAATFDPGANDGAGHDYYSLMIQTPGSTIPAGGLATQVLMKSVNDVDYAVTWGFHLPIGGATGQTIIKLSGTADHAGWEFMDAASVGFTPATGSPFSSDNVADALEEIAAGSITNAADVPYSPGTASGLTSDNVQDALDELGSSLGSTAGGGGGGGSTIGRHTIWMPATAMLPQTTSGPATGLVEMVVNRTMVATLDYDSATREDAQFSIAMPKSWNLAGVRYRVFWSHATATTFGITMGMQAMAISDNAALDASWGSSQQVSDTGGTADRLYVSDISDPITIALTPSEGDLIYFRLYRFPTGGSDTLDVDCRIHGVQVFYTTTADTDD